ncbi:expressed unknown protein [Seminavis robusta]|uniref:Uncharacterized protein n=1 Tax=Seminavis robusta TaxID=568900 RepID=A0A9N8DZL6_9STRA|nr:expressed unknown protein [Seminavis robusta]|eukprot:Sro403_g135750.1 n/a (1550) ;mRNA; r:55064-59713
MEDNNQDNRDEKATKDMCGEAPSLVNGSSNKDEDDDDRFFRNDDDSDDNDSVCGDTNKFDCIYSQECEELLKGQNLMARFHRAFHKLHPFNCIEAVDVEYMEHTPDKRTAYKASKEWRDVNNLHRRWMNTRRKGLPEDLNLMELPQGEPVGPLIVYKISTVKGACPSTFYRLVMFHQLFASIKRSDGIAFVWQVLQSYRQLCHESNMMHHPCFILAIMFGNMVRAPHHLYPLLRFDTMPGPGYIHLLRGLATIDFQLDRATIHQHQHTNNHLANLVFDLFRKQVLKVLIGRTQDQPNDDDDTKDGDDWILPLKHPCTRQLLAALLTIRILPFIRLQEMVQILVGIYAMQYERVDLPESQFKFDIWNQVEQMYSCEKQFDCNTNNNNKSNPLSYYQYQQEFVLPTVEQAMLVLQSQKQGRVKMTPKAIQCFLKALSDADKPNRKRIWARLRASWIKQRYIKYAKMGLPPRRQASKQQQQQKTDGSIIGNNNEAVQGDTTTTNNNRQAETTVAAAGEPQAQVEETEKQEEQGAEEVVAGDNPDLSEKPVAEAVMDEAKKGMEEVGASDTALAHGDVKDNPDLTEKPAKEAEEVGATDLPETHAAEAVLEEETEKGVEEVGISDAALANEDSRDNQGLSEKPVTEAVLEEEAEKGAEEVGASDAALAHGDVQENPGLPEKPVAEAVMEEVGAKDLPEKPAAEAVSEEAKKGTEEVGTSDAELVEKDAKDNPDLTETPAAEAVSEEAREDAADDPGFAQEAVTDGVGSKETREEEQVRSVGSPESLAYSIATQPPYDRNDINASIDIVGCHGDLSGANFVHSDTQPGSVSTNSPHNGNNKIVMNADSISREKGRTKQQCDLPVTTGLPGDDRSSCGGANTKAGSQIDHRTARKVTPIVHDARGQHRTNITSNSTSNSSLHTGRSACGNSQSDHHIRNPATLTRSPLVADSRSCELSQTTIPTLQNTPKHLATDDDNTGTNNSDTNDGRNSRSKDDNGSTASLTASALHIDRTSVGESSIPILQNTNSGSCENSNIKDNHTPKSTTTRPRKVERSSLDDERSPNTCHVQKNITLKPEATDNSSAGDCKANVNADNHLATSRSPSSDTCSQDPDKRSHFAASIKDRTKDTTNTKAQAIDGKTNTDSQNHPTTTTLSNSNHQKEPIPIDNHMGSITDSNDNPKDKEFSTTDNLKTSTARKSIPVRSSGKSNMKDCTAPQHNNLDGSFPVYRDHPKDKNDPSQSREGSINTSFSPGSSCIGESNKDHGPTGKLDVTTTSSTDATSSAEKQPAIMDGSQDGNPNEAASGSPNQQESKVGRRTFEDSTRAINEESNKDKSSAGKVNAKTNSSIGSPAHIDHSTADNDQQQESPCVETSKKLGERKRTKLGKRKRTMEEEEECSKQREEEQKAARRAAKRARKEAKSARKAAKKEAKQIEWKQVEKQREMIPSQLLEQNRSSNVAQADETLADKHVYKPNNEVAETTKATKVEAQKSGTSNHPSDGGKKRRQRDLSESSKEEANRETKVEKAKKQKKKKQPRQSEPIPNKSKNWVSRRRW